MHVGSWGLKFEVRSLKLSMKYELVRIYEYPVSMMLLSQPVCYKFVNSDRFVFCRFWCKENQKEYISITFFFKTYKRFCSMRIFMTSFKSLYEISLFVKFTWFISFNSFALLRIILSSFTWKALISMESFISSVLR